VPGLPSNEIKAAVVRDPSPPGLSPDLRWAIAREVLLGHGGTAIIQAAEEVERITNAAAVR
jgi:hypothetical protein